MNNILRNTALLISVICLAGCEKFLDRYPTDAVSSNTVYQSKELAEAAVMGIYSNIQYDYVSADLGRLNWDAFAGVIDPYYDCFYSNYSYLNGNIQKNDNSFLTYWKRLYEGVNRANDVIANIGNVTDMDETLKAKRLAECKFLRAYHYYKLNAIWGGVPYYDANLAPSEYTRPRISQDEVWDNLIADLTSCIECDALPDKYSSSSADFGRVTKGAAYALRGKIYMWKKMWAAAESDFKSVASCGYALLQKPYADLFTVANETSDEIIFSARMTELSGYGNAFSRTYGSWQVAGKGGNNTFYMNQQFVDTYPCRDGRDFKWDDFIPGYSSMTPEARSVYFLRNNMTDAEITAMANYGADMSKYLPAGNEERLKAVFDARDPRLAATVMLPNTVYNGGFFGPATDYYRRWPFRGEQGPYYDVKTKANNNFFYTIRKFVTTGLTCVNETYNPVDIPIIRYAQVLIDLAECLNEQNKPAEAAACLNQVRKRAGAGEYATTLSSAELRNKIIGERRWERALEEVLYYDERRLGTWKDFRFAKDNGLCEPWGTPSYKVQWGGDAFYNWPVPAKEVEMNSNLIQNEGWN